MGGYEQLSVTVLVILLPVASAVAIQWATQKSAMAQRIQSYKGLVAPYFVSIGLLFSLFAVFLANEIWIRAQDQAHERIRSLEYEAGGLQSLQQIAVALGDSGAAIRAAVADYIEISMTEEQKASSGPASSSIDDALQRIADAILGSDLVEGGHAIAQTQLLESYREILRARADRSLLSDYQRDIYKWSGMVLLGVVTQIAIGMVHIENKKAEAAGLFLFTVAFVATIVMLVLSENTVSELTVDSLDIVRRHSQ